MSNSAERGSGAVSALKALEGTKLYDLIAGAPLIAWFACCAARQFSLLLEEMAQTDSVTVDALSVMRLVSRLTSLIFVAVLVVLLAFRHIPQGKIHGFYPRVAALAGTYLGVGIVLLPLQELWVPLYPISTALVLGGTLFALYTVLALGRSLSMLPEARVLVTEGPYAVIRHPLYLGEAIALTGLTLQHLSPWAVAILALQCAFQLERMKSEERVLSGTFPKYRDYMARTARLVPKVY